MIHQTDRKTSDIVQEIMLKQREVVRKAESYDMTGVARTDMAILRMQASVYKVTTLLAGHMEELIQEVRSLMSPQEITEEDNTECGICHMSYDTCICRGGTLCSVCGKNTANCDCLEYNGGK
jgi:hypothetical protein